MYVSNFRLNKHKELKISIFYKEYIKSAFVQVAQELVNRISFLSFCTGLHTYSTDKKLNYGTFEEKFDHIRKLVG